MQIKNERVVNKIPKNMVQNFLSLLNFQLVQ